MEGLTAGCSVHYELSDEGHLEAYCPATIVSLMRDGPPYTVLLFAFRTGVKQGCSEVGGMTWAREVAFSERPERGTWHWGRQDCFAVQRLGRLRD